MEQEVSQAFASTSSSEAQGSTPYFLPRATNRVVSKSTVPVSRLAWQVLCTKATVRFCAGTGKERWRSRWAWQGPGRPTPTDRRHHGGRRCNIISAHAHPLFNLPSNRTRLCNHLFVCTRLASSTSTRLVNNQRDSGCGSNKRADRVDVYSQATTALFMRTRRLGEAGCRSRPQNTRFNASINIHLCT